MTKPSKKNRIKSPGPLAILGVLLFLSGTLRLISGPVAALATDPLFPDAEPMAAEMTAGCFPDQDVDLWITELADRDAMLSAQQETLATEREELALARQLVAEQLSALEAAQQQLRRDLHAAGETAVGDVAQLTDVYQRMKPKEAAAVFEKMDPEFAAGFLARMKPDAAAQIMAGLQPETAYVFSAILAGRNARLAPQ